MAGEALPEQEKSQQEQARHRAILDDLHLYPTPHAGRALAVIAVVRLIGGLVPDSLVTA
jgi:hypothetical protein